MAEQQTQQQRLVLASTSPFRRELLGRLGLKFELATPDADETPRPAEQAGDLVERLAIDKARSVANRFPDALIIGSDQVAVLDDAVLGKPGDHRNAVRQLTRASGRRVEFFTGLCLLNSADSSLHSEVVPFSVVFRRLTTNQIEHYLEREQPYNCAGSFRSEGLGIALFERMEGDDPSALIGLPLICLTRMLEAEGIEVL